MNEKPCNLRLCYILQIWANLCFMEKLKEQEHEFSNWCDKDEVSELIDNMPSADVVEVVRCKDCKWRNKAGCALRIVDDSDKPSDDDFCSYGERKE